MRKSRKYELGTRERRIVVPDEAHVLAPKARLFAAALVRGRECKSHPRVARDQRTQLAPGVAAGTEDSNRDSMHDECILLRVDDVNAHTLLPAHRLRH